MRPSRTFGELKQRVRAAALSRDGDFNGVMIAHELQEDRRVVATVLRRLFQSQEIIKVRSARGTLAALYRRRDAGAWTRIAETLNWIAVGDRKPDADVTVLLFMPDADEPVWPGFWNGEGWYLPDGMDAADTEKPVTHWANFPAGPGGGK